MTNRERKPLSQEQIKAMHSAVKSQTEKLREQKEALEKSIQKPKT